MKKLFILIYGIINYNLGSLALVALVAFLFNLIPGNPVINGIDAGETGNIALAIAVNVGLIALFGLQHSVMARPAFKQWLSRYIPPAAERSTFMIATAVVTFALILCWQPITTTVWQADSTTAYFTLLTAGLLGWTLVFYSTFQINHFDLFGLRQVWLYFRDREYTQLPFQVNGLYKYIRHPIMTGALIGIWFTPVMTLGHLVFALGMSAYILIGVYHEEKDLVKAFGKQYRAYIQNTAKFIPSRL
ncbi:MAG: NnrU family protein [Gammaproteobacteria bacterium]|jgi:protein-S-isoprenylcysteine O-methyltransferase Ste14